MSKTAKKKGLTTHPPMKTGGEAQTLAAARKLHELREYISRWVLFYHKNDREFTQVYTHISNALALGEADLEFRIDPKLAREAWEKE